MVSAIIHIRYPDISVAAGLKDDQSNREKNFGNVVSHERRLQPRASSLIKKELNEMQFYFSDKINKMDRI